jgi:hypothetical protein
MNFIDTEVLPRIAGFVAIAPPLWIIAVIVFIVALNTHDAAKRRTMKLNALYLFLAPIIIFAFFFLVGIIIGLFGGSV